MLEGLRDEVIAMSDSVAAIEGTKAFVQAYRELESAPLSEPEYKALVNFYSAEFLPALQANLDSKPVIEQYLPSGNAERWLQYHYIVANNQPYLKNSCSNSPQRTFPGTLRSTPNTTVSSIERRRSLASKTSCWSMAIR
jgi:hypothetical protein